MQRCLFEQSYWWILLSFGTNSRNQVAHVTKFCTLAPSIFSVCMMDFPPLFTKNVYQYTYIMQKVPENNEVQGAFQNCGSSAWNLLHVTLPVHRTSRWLPNFFWKTCGPRMWQYVVWEKCSDIRWQPSSQPLLWDLQISVIFIFIKTLIFWKPLCLKFWTFTLYWCSLLPKKNFASFLGKFQNLYQI